MLLRSLALVAVSAAWMMLPATSALADQICSNTAEVSWDVDLDTIMVTGVYVEVAGCDDGAFVGIEVITVDGDVPDDGPIAGEVEDEVAIFDLSALGLHVEPVTGIRVYLETHGIPTPIVTITVEQRYFNPAGNEQIGHRRTTDLVAPLHGEYRVPHAGPGYEDVDCDGVNLVLGNDEPDAVATGPGDFTATRAGVHRVCYRQTAGPPREQPGGGPPLRDDDADEPEVLDVVLDREEDAQGGTPSQGSDTDRATASVLGNVLARTGLDLGQLLWIGIGFVLLGGWGARARPGARATTHGAPRPPRD